MLGDTPASVIVGVAERAGPIFRLPSFYVAIDKSSITFRVAASARPMLVRAIMLAKHQRQGAGRDTGR